MPSYFVRKITSYNLPLSLLGVLFLGIANNTLGLAAAGQGAWMAVSASLIYFGIIFPTFGLGLSLGVYRWINTNEYVLYYNLEIQPRTLYFWAGIFSVIVGALALASGLILMAVHRG